METLIDREIPRKRCSIIDPPKCSCWEEFVSTMDSEHALTWLRPAHWAPGLFAGAPECDQNRARVCSNTGRIVHIFSGEHYIDLVVLDEHPNSRRGMPLFVQHGYCFKCKRFEWFRYCSVQPDTPIIWFACSETKKRDEPPKK